MAPREHIPRLCGWCEGLCSDKLGTGCIGLMVSVQYTYHVSAARRCWINSLTGDEQIREQDEGGLLHASDVSQSLVGI